MHKTVSITISGMLFNVEEDAYRDLDTYLSAIRAHFKRYPDPDEIVSDIEGRIAEEFSGMLSAKKKVVTKKDVADLITRMGTIEDFAEFEGEHAEEPPREEAKTEEKGWQLPQGRLYRDAEDQILGGVCAGLANYVRIDPAIMRLIFVLLAFFNGFGILLYIILWVILPEARTPTEKVEMSRERVTLSAIQQKVKQTVASEKSRSTARKVIAVPILVLRRVFELLSKTIAVLGPVLLRIIGFFIILGCALAIAGITTILVLMIVNPDAVMVDFPLQGIIGDFNYLALLFSTYFLVFLPVVFVLMLGASLLNMKSAFSAKGFIGIVAVWCGALIVAGVTGFSVAPTIKTAADRMFSERVATSSKTFTVRDFDRVQVGGANRLVLEKSDDPSVTVEASVREIPGITAVVRDNTLVFERQPFNERCFFFCPGRQAVFTVRAPRIAGVEADGVSHAEVTGFSGGELTLRVDGNASMKADVSPRRLVVDGNGVSYVTLSGSANETVMTFDGNSSLDGRAFNVKTADVTTKGISSIVLDVVESLKARAYGNSTILYIRRPAALETETDGVSHVGPENEEEQVEW